MSAIAMYADVIFIVFLAGALVGIFVIVCWASNHEDKNKSIKGPPAGNGTGGVRHLIGVGKRGTADDGFAGRSGPQRRQEWGQDR
jgi:hypothetical protein